MNIKRNGDAFCQPNRHHQRDDQIWDLICSFNYTACGMCLSCGIDSSKFKLIVTESKRMFWLKQIQRQNRHFVAQKMLPFN
jgi:hypothetical protein